VSNICNYYFSKSRFACKLHNVECKLKITIGMTLGVVYGATSKLFALLLLLLLLSYGHLYLICIDIFEMR